jgi:transcriptional regulator with XRE-family HTH domain
MSIGFEKIFNLFVDIMQRYRIIKKKEVHIMKIGEKIKQRRIELEWSQRDLADRMGYSNHSTLARIETGKVDVSQTRIVQFAEVLGVSVAYLMDWEDKKTPVKTDELNRRKLIEFAESVPEDKAERVLQLMKLILQND